MSNRKPLIKFFEIKDFTVSVVVSVTSAIIYMQIISRIGSIHNTADGTPLAIARFPFRSMPISRFLDRQDLTRVMTSSGSFATGSKQYRFADAGMSVSL